MANSRNYRTPTADDDADVPYWNDLLAQDVAKDVDVLEADVATAALHDAIDPAVGYGIVDEDLRRTELEVGPDGKFTQRVVDSIGTRLAPQIAAAAAAGSGLQDQTTAVTGIGYGVVDEDLRRTELEVGPDGKFTQRVVDSLRTRITGGAAVADAVVCSGDSMTGGASGTPYPSHLAALTNWNVVNMGVGGETSTTISARMGGRPMLAMPDGGSIPASGGVLVTLTSDDGIAAPTPLLQQYAGVNPVQIAGIEGTLSIDNTTAPHIYTFTRSAAGTAVPVNYRTPVITQAMRDYRSGIHVMWWGTNDATGDMTDVIARQRALIEHMSDARQRYLVIGLTISSSAYRATSTHQFRREFGRRFIDLADYLISPAALQDAGITPTQADLDAQGTGNVPPSLRADPTHLNNAGNILVAKQVQKRITEMGWK
jgi:hypothetical protein